MEPIEYDPIINTFFVAPVSDLVMKHYDIQTKYERLFLDVGCGLGEKTELFRIKGMKTIGIDMDCYALQRAKINYNLCKL